MLIVPPATMMIINQSAYGIGPEESAFARLAGQQHVIAHVVQFIAQPGADREIEPSLAVI